MRLLLFGLSIVAISLSALADNSLFDESASRGELDAIRRQGDAVEAALIGLDELQRIFLVQQMQRGDCDPALDIEADAKSGDAKQQLFLAQLYSDGLCFPKDEVLAARWLSEASKQGNAEASRRLALAFQEGRGVENNQALAASYMTKAAEADDV
jgi:TPR repeat protein